MAAAAEDCLRDDSKQQHGAFRAKLQALNNNSSSSNNNCCSSGSSGGDAVMILTPADGHAKSPHSCFPSSDSPAAPDSPTDSHLSMDPPATFSEQEDEFLRELVKRHGTKKWHIISAKMHNKTPRECRKRWRTYLHMCMNKSSWSEEEDRLLIEGHNAYGNRWTEIAKMVPGRTDNAVKNRYNALCKKRSRRPGKSASLNGMPALQNSEKSDQIVKDIAKRGKKLKYREDGTGVFMPCASRSSCVKQNLSIEIPGDSEIQRIEGGRKPLSALSNSEASSFQEIRDCATGDTNSPRDGQVDMEEVMGWLLARTPTPTCNGSGNSNSTVTSSTSTSPARANEDIRCSYQGNAVSLRKDSIHQLPLSLKTPTSSRASVLEKKTSRIW
ncbi:unnamed protein product [Calypogeia fissa]